MKNFLLIGLLSLLSGVSWSQCATGNPGTNCNGPLTVQPQSGNTGQSAITLVDLGLAVPAPAVGQYTLSIASGMLLESDNGNSYHSLVGPPPQGAAGSAGPQGAQGQQGPTGALDLQVRPGRARKGPGKGRPELWPFPLTSASTTAQEPGSWARCGHKRSWGLIRSRSDRYVECGLSPLRDYDRYGRSAEWKLRSGRVHARRNELVCTVGRSTCDSVQRNLLEWLAGHADRGKRRLRGADCRAQRR